MHCVYITNTFINVIPPSYALCSVYDKQYIISYLWITFKTEGFYARVKQTPTDIKFNHETK